jgi:hypothetical protein
MISHDGKLRAIKALHTVIWAFFTLLIFYILYSGISGKISLLTWIAIACVIGEGLILVAFKWSCPLTVMARRYSDSEKYNFDIYLPEWLAQYNKEIFTPIFLIGLVLVLLRVTF